MSQPEKTFMSLRCLHLTLTECSSTDRISKELAALVNAGVAATVVTGSNMYPTGAIGVPLPRWMASLPLVWRAPLAVLFSSLLIMRRQPHVVHVHHPAFIPLVLLTRLFGARFVYDADEDALPRAEPTADNSRSLTAVMIRVSMRIERIAVTYAAGLVAPSPTVAGYFGRAGKTIVFSGLPFGVRTNGHCEDEEFREAQDRDRLLSFYFSLAECTNAVRGPSSV